MRRKVVYKSTAIRAVIIIFALMAILSIYPLRIWQRNIEVTGGGEIVQTSERINDYHDLVQKFRAQYDRLDSVDLYVDGVEKGVYMTLVVLDPDMLEIYHRYVYFKDYDVPGYINIKVGMDLEVGKVYTIVLNGAFSTFYVKYEDVPEGSMDYFPLFSFHDTEMQGLRLALKYNYHQPLTKETSLILIALIAVCAAVLCGIVKLIYKNRTDKLLTVHRVVKFVANPIAAAIVITLMALIYPVKMFDSRPLEIVFLEIGVAISGIMLFYAINHESDATLDTKLWHNVMNLLQMSMIAAAIWFCCEYMNALFTVYQTLAERKEMICLLLLLCLSLPKTRVTELKNVVYLIVAVIAGVWYRSAHLETPDIKEYDLHNEAMTYAVIIAIIAGFLLLNFGAEIIERIKSRKRAGAENAARGVALYPSQKMTPFGFLIIAMFAGIIIFRNGRWWGVALALFVMGLMFCFRNFGFARKEGSFEADPEHAGERAATSYSELVAGGLLLNFIVSMVYCWLYRSFAAFNTGRYAFVFHTVTITAEYMTVMEIAAAVLLFYKIYKTREMTGFYNRFKYMWKEFIIFGFVSAYMIFTVSRTSYLACIAAIGLMMLISLGDCEKGKLKHLGVQIVTMILAVVICFPAAFSLQRICPAIVGHPKKFLVETGNFGLYGGGQPNSNLYMGIERFVDLFSEKILNIDLYDYNYPEDVYNYDSDGLAIYGETGVTITKSMAQSRITTLDEMYAAEQTPQEIKDYLLESCYDIVTKNLLYKSDEENTVTYVPEEMTEIEQKVESFSNGRLTIFKSYLSQLNLGGHEEMGAYLPNGELAVHAHNSYIQAMYDNGIIAGILFILVFAVAFFYGGIYYVRHKETVPAALLPFGMTIGFGVAAISEWVFQFSNPMTIALMLSFMPIAFVNKKK